jgi:serine/threonine-protein kinase
MGEVYEAYDTVKDRVVALKLLDVELAKDPIYVERFRRESHAAARLQEPHVIPVHDWGEVDGVLYIDMRMVQGHDLKRRLQTTGPLAPAEAVAIVEQIAAALDAAHQLGLIHRDVKPANILLTSDDFAYLVDFGIAHSESDAGLTVTGSAIGSFAYMAPERFESLPSSAGADIYALTCVLYECLTGRVPFEADSNLGTIRAHMMSPPPRPSAVLGIPASLDAVIATGMAKDPGRRYATAGHLARAARAALQQADQSAANRAAPTMVRRTDPLDRTRVGPTPAATEATRTPYRSDAAVLPGHRSGRTHPSAPLPLPPPSRSGTSPVLAGLIGGLVVLLLIGIGVWLYLAHNQNQPSTGDAGGSGGSTTTSVAAQYPPTTYGTTTPYTSTPADVVPTTLPPLSAHVTGADQQGYTDLMGPRCNSNDPAVLIGRTDLSRLVVCMTGAGAYYYRGARVSDGAGIELADPVPLGGYSAFTAVNPADGTRYRITANRLIIVRGGQVLSDEPMREYSHR